MKLGHSERERKGVYGLGGLWRIVWCMVIGVIGAVKLVFSQYPVYSLESVSSEDMP